MAVTARRTQVAALACALLLAAAAAVAAVGLPDGATLPGDGARPASSPRSHGHPVVTQRLPGRLVDTIGVASYNAYRHLGLAAARADWDRITANRQIDVIGWQEAKSPAFRALYPRYVARGWQTWHWPDPDGPISLAFSWRSDRLALLDVEFHKMHDGGYPRETDSPFPARWVVQATFRHLASGRTLTLLDTHLNQHIETGTGFQDNLNAARAKIHLRKLARLWDSAPGDLVVGTGDYNFDYADDSQHRPRGGITRTIAGHATSSYQVLGTRGILPTRNSRWIDYVWISDRTLRTSASDAGTGQFVRHRVLTGYHSDHRPILARIRWYARG